jgi:hypothetical protein
MVYAEEKKWGHTKNSKKQSSEVLNRPEICCSWIILSKTRNNQIKIS